MDAKISMDAKMSMDAKISIEEAIETTYNQSIRKIKKSPLTAIVYLIIGICFIVINNKTNSQSADFVSPTLIMLAAIFIILAIMVFFFSKRYYVSVESGEKLKTYELFFDLKERDKLVKLFTNGKIEDLKMLQKSNHDGLKLRIMKTKTNDFCISQIITYIPYEYVRVTEPKKNSFDESKILDEVIHKFSK